MVVQSNEEVGSCIVYWKVPPSNTAKPRQHKAWLKVRQTSIFVSFITPQLNIIIKQPQVLENLGPRARAVFSLHTNS